MFREYSAVKGKNCFENTEAEEKQKWSEDAKLLKIINALRPRCLPESKTVAGCNTCCGAKVIGGGNCCC